MGQVFAEVMLAALVTVGVISLMQWVRQRLLMPPQVTVAVTVFSLQDMNNLDILLSEAVAGDARHRGAPVVVLISSALLRRVSGSGEALPPDVQTVIDDFGAVWYPVSVGDIPPTD